MGMCAKCYKSPGLSLQQTFCLSTTWFVIRDMGGVLKSPRGKSNQQGVGDKQAIKQDPNAGTDPRYDEGTQRQQVEGQRNMQAMNIQDDDDDDDDDDAVSSCETRLFFVGKHESSRSGIAGRISSSPHSRGTASKLHSVPLPFFLVFASFCALLCSWDVSCLQDPVDWNYQFHVQLPCTWRKSAKKTCGLLFTHRNCCFSWSKSWSCLFCCREKTRRQGKSQHN